MSAHLFESVETSIIENRKNPRYKVTASGTLCGMPAALRNISRTGAQFACPARDFARINEALHEPRVSVELFLEPRLAFSAQVIYANRAAGEYLVGVHFVQVEPLDQALLEEYLRTLL